MNHLKRTTLPDPANLYFVGRNYAKHISELNNERPEKPLIFTKPLSCLVASPAVLRYPDHSRSVHFEGEMVFLLPPVSSWGEDVTILAGCGLDFTARDVQTEAKSKGLPWFEAKCFRGSAVVSGDWVEIRLGDLPRLTVETMVNGERRQKGSYREKLFPLPRLVRHLTGLVDLTGRDLLFTGTPAGVGEVVPGDQLEVRLMAEGVLLTHCACEVTDGRD